MNELKKIEIELPNGAIMEDVPADATDAQIKQEAIRIGLAKESDFGVPKTQEDPKSLSDKTIDVVKGQVGNALAPLDYALNMGSGMLAKTASDLAGLGAIGVDALGISDVDPAQVKQNVQEAMTYDTKTDVGDFLATTMWNPINLVGKGIHATADYLGSFGEDEAGDSPLGMLANAIREGVIHAPVFIGAKMHSQKLKDTKQKALNRDKDRNILIDNARTEAQAVGLRTPAETGVKSQISGMTKTNKALSEFNTNKATDIIKKDIGIKPNEPINPNIGGNLDIAKQNYYAIYAEVSRGLKGGKVVVNTFGKKDFITGKQSVSSKSYADMIAPTKTFKDTLTGYLKEVESLFKHDPKLNKSYKEVIGLFKEQLSKKVFDPEIMMRNISNLRRDAKAVYKNPNSKPSDTKSASGRMAIATALEDLMESHLAAVGKPELMTAYKNARKQLAKIHVVETAMHPVTGLISLPTLVSLSDRASKGSKIKGDGFTGGVKLVTDFAKTFPKAAADVKGATGYLTMFDTAVAAASLIAGHPMVAATEVGVRLLAPRAAVGGLLQNKTPSYKASNMKSGLFTGASVINTGKDRKNLLKL